VGAYLAFAEAHYLLFPAMRAGEIRTPGEEWFNVAGQIAIIGLAAWFMWAPVKQPGTAPNRFGPWVSFGLFCAGGCFEYLQVSGWISQPRWHWVATRPALTLAYSVLNIGSDPGRGWEWARPPLANEVAWFAVLMCVAGAVWVVCGRWAAVCARGVLHRRSVAQS
jgi:hypothetical protein